MAERRGYFSALTRMEDFTTPATFLQNLRHGSVATGTSPLRVHLNTTLVRLSNHLWRAVVER
jgi:hypothetical protein